MKTKIKKFPVVLLIIAALVGWNVEIWATDDGDANEAEQKTRNHELKDASLEELEENVEDVITLRNILHAHSACAAIAVELKYLDEKRKRYEEISYEHIAQAKKVAEQIIAHEIQYFGGDTFYKFVPNVATPDFYVGAEFRQLYLPLKSEVAMHHSKNRSNWSKVRPSVFNLFEEKYRDKNCPAMLYPR